MSKIADFTEQPDARTCQSAAIAKVLGLTSASDVQSIRRELVRGGSIAGDPHVMAAYLKPRVAEYKLLLEGSLQELKDWVKRGKGYEAIIHGNTTHYGHVWGVEDLVIRKALPYFKCDDPWYEFDFNNARFTNRTGANVLYSDLGIWAYCVHSWSFPQAQAAYIEGFREYYQPGFVEQMNSAKGGWFHLIKN